MLVPRGVEARAHHPHGREGAVAAVRPAQEGEVGAVHARRHLMARRRTPAAVAPVAGRRDDGDGA
eukprot:COSAG04_NODE_219_length_19842_cov_1164.283695_17_plen_65_part_00